MEQVEGDFQMFKAFLTGSRVYGTPREDSDIDLVVFMDPSEGYDLAMHFNAEVSRPGNGRYPGAQFVVGGLDVIIVTDGDAYDAWEKGTRKLIEQAPVTREHAIKVFAELRNQSGQEPKRNTAQ